MMNKELLLVVMIGAMLGALGLGMAQACTCPTATSVTVAWPDGGVNAKATMGAAIPGYKEFECRGSAYPTCNTPDLLWSYQSISGIDISWQPTPPLGGTVLIKLQNLPSFNSKFGQHWVKASVDGKYDLGYYRLYFMADSTDHPGGGTANFFYYYNQTAANGGETTYFANFQGDAGGFTTVSDGQWKAFITVHGNDPMDRDSWGDPSYIDRFAWTERHEVKHVTLMTAMWGVTVYDAAQDNDGDALKDSDEATYYRGGYNNANPCTYQDQVDYGQNPIPDSEDVCMRALAAPYGVDVLWQNGSANTVDWANPGKQY